MSSIPDNIRSGNYFSTWSADVQYTPEMQFGGFNNAPLFYGSPIVEDLGVWWICKGPTVPVKGTHPASDAAWTKFAITTGDGTGTVTSVSVVTANGMGGTVATATTTPAITLTTSVTGIVKGNGAAFSAAVAGTDYVIPSGSITGNAATATNITGGLAGQVLYQSDANVTAKLANGTGFLHNDGSGTLAWQAESGLGTVTDFIFTDGNGIAGTVSTSTTTPTLALTTTVTGIVKGNGTAFSEAVSGVDYSAGTSALATGILKSTTTTGDLSIAAAGDFPTLNQNTTGYAAGIAGGAVNQLLVQTGLNATGFIGTANNSILATDGSGVPAMTAVLPAINIGAGLVTDPTTSTTDSINTTLANLNLKIESGVHSLGAEAVAVVNITISNPGTDTFDGVTVTSGQAVLLQVQTDDTENGLYIFNGSGVAMTRSTSMNTWDEVQGALVVVPQSTTYIAGSAWISTVGPGGTIGVTPITFSKLPAGSGTVTTVSATNINGFTFNITNPTTTPDITLSTSFTGIAYSNGTGLAAAIAANFPTLNQDTTGNAATATALQGSLTNFAVLLGDGTGTPTTVSGVGTSGQLLKSQGEGLPPIWATDTGTGTVTSFSFIDANGFMGSVADTTTTPALTLNINQTGVLYGDGTAISGVTNASGYLFNDGSGVLSYSTPPDTNGLAPYDSDNSYIKGEFIAGDGTNNAIGGIYVATDSTTGDYDPTKWAAEVVLDLTDVTKVNYFSGTAVMPTNGGNGLNTFIGWNCGNMPTIDGTGNYGSGVSTLISTAGLSGNYNVVVGNYAMGSGNATSAYGNTILGYQSGLGLTTGFNNLLLNYQAGLNFTTNKGNIVLGYYQGTAITDNDLFVIANPDNGTVVMKLTGTDSAPAANLVLATPNGSTGAGDYRALVAADLPSTITSDTTGNAATATALEGSLTNHAVLLGAGTGVPGTVAGLGTAGQVLTSNGAGADPTFQDVPSDVLTYDLVSGTTQALAVNKGYSFQNAALTTGTLPVTAAFGTIIEIAGYGAGGWTIAQNAGQNIVIANDAGGATTTAGVLGSISSSTRYDTLKLLCVVADTTWQVIGFTAPNGLVIA